VIRLELVARDADVEAGDSIRVAVAWSGVAAEARAIRVSAQADIVLDADHHEVAGSRVTAEVPVSSRSGDGEVDLLLPLGSPASYIGRRFSIVWSVNAVLDIARGRDERYAGPSFRIGAAGSRVRAALERAKPPTERW
jgi:hypothetical protein